MVNLQRTSKASARAIRQLLSSRSLATHAATTSSGSSGEPSSSSSWSPRLAPGVCPAYDEALLFISSQQASLKRRIASLESSQSSAPSPQTSALIESLRVASQINDPQVRWAFEHTAEDKLDLTDPTTRYLRERAWRKCGALDKLIERMRIQYVLPDSVATIVPTVDLQLILGSTTGPGVGDHTVQSSDPPPSGDVLAGVCLEQRHIFEQPILRLTSFNAEKGKKYSLIMVDLDRPDQEGKLVLHAHWLVSDISLSASEPRLMTASDSLGGKSILPYLPPYPAKGTGMHRYVCLLAEQTSSDITPAATSVRRSSFELRDYLSSNHLEPVGVHFFRSQWTETSKNSISQVWKQSSEGEDEGTEEIWGNIGRKERKRREEAPEAAAFEGVD